MSKEIILITGANTGIGSRSMSKAADAIAKLFEHVPVTQNTVEGLQIDIADDESIQRAAHMIANKWGRVDVLVNNAGIAFDVLIGTDTTNARSVFNDTYNINVSGTNMVTFVLASLLLKSTSPRLLFLTSGLSTMGGFTQSHRPAYRCSKAAINMLMLIWNFTLKQDGVKTWAIAPGLLATSMVGDPEALKQRGAQPPSLGGDFIKSVIEGERDADAGKVIARDGVIQPW
ncbi:short chain dehydrogenase domain-containing protein [Trichoderma breve]|uniref:Short chain dehydrogenase domain-containing protein n=1 Tax=Trichoderma breve TaxID=2034170 RepID=A0A9W9E2R5_9HYPO|nr:short chain dehydrogenase domain-containing protein [Trichoderma breve]KAJ4856743.1 short chain dehydrogenase domain-containing protein [Trichoderma breve]